MKPEVFFEALVGTLTTHASEVAGRWDRTRDYTELIRNSVPPEIGKRIGMKCYSRDYYTLDCIYYEDCDFNNFAVGTAYAKYIAVALEHENDVTGSAAEMNKLQLFNVPLKVLITYVAQQSFSSGWIGMQKSLRMRTGPEMLPQSGAN